MENEIDLGYRPRPPQLEIHHAVNRNRFTVVVAHRRMGKTVSAILHLINAALNNEQKDPRYAYITWKEAEVRVGIIRRFEDDKDVLKQILKRTCELVKYSD
jgi:predicted nucleic acid-binding protein